VKPTDLTLLEQVQLHEIEIGRRMEMLEITDEDKSLLKRCQGIFEHNVDSVVKEFYEKLLAINEISLIIGDADTLGRLKSYQRKYILDLFSGYYDSQYANNRLRIGLVHKRIGVEPKYYLTAVKMLKDFILDTIDREIAEPQRKEKTKSALEKLFYFDIVLVFDAFIRSMLMEIELSKNEAIEYAHVLEEKVARRTKELNEISRTDELTQLYNRRAFLEFFRGYLATANRQKTPLSLVYFDVDNFKEINDTRGHHQGDELLITVGETLKEISREGDVAGRYGGDEFCILLYNTTSTQAKQYCKRFIKLFAGKTDATLSIGIAQTDEKGIMDSDSLISRADEAMYQAKEIEGNSVVCYTEPSED